MENNIAVQAQVEEMIQNFVHEVASERKRPTWLGKLNRTAANAMKLIEANGHSDTRFKRDYVNGVSSYICKHCGAGALAIAVNGRGKSKMEGAASTTPCSNISSQK